jgi:hypothetical protein
MATFQPRKITELSTKEVLSNCTSGGDNFYNSGTEFIKFVNDHASAHYDIVLTPSSTKVVTSVHGSSTKSATTIALQDGEEAYVGPFKQGVWSGGDNKVSITYNVTGGTDAISTISSGVHALKAELLFLDPK